MRHLLGKSEDLPLVHSSKLGVHLQVLLIQRLRSEKKLGYTFPDRYSALPIKELHSKSYAVFILSPAVLDTGDHSAEHAPPA